MATTRRVAIPLTERQLPVDAERVEAVPADEPVDVTVYVRRRADQPDLPDPEDLGALPGLTGRTVDDDEFALRYGADPDDIAKVEEFARAHKLEVVESSPEKRSVTLRGTSKAAQEAFGVKLARYRSEGQTFRGRQGPVTVPAEVADVVESVFGLDDRRVGKTRLRRSNQVPSGLGLSTVRAAGLPPNTFLPPQVADIYRYPAGTDGTGQSIAILAFNDSTSHGGYSIDAVTTYFEQVLQIPVPKITDVVVRGPGNDPGTDDGSDPFDSSGEIMLDLQVVGSCAPGADIVMYFTEFTERGWVDAVNAIITDTTHRPSVISVSYGNPEDDPRSAWTAAAILKVNEAFRAAAAKGITICCASGDDGSRDQANDGRAHADFPASSPYVLACGGTRIVAPQGVPLYELTWNNGPGSATGGGVSRIFPVPRYQQHAGVPPSANPDRHVGRGVPDVSGLADPETGVAIATLDGEHLAIIGGTSLTAPLWSSLVARLNQALETPLGFLNPLLYRFLHYPVLRDIIHGNNGAYAAGPGWDACTGLGSPDGARLLAAIRTVIAQTPGTPHAADAPAAGAPGGTAQPGQQPGQQPDRPPGQQPGAPSTLPTAAQPFVDATARLVDAFREAWQPAASAKSDSAPDLVAFRHAAAAAHLEWVGAVKERWAQTRASDLDAYALTVIGTTIAGAGEAVYLALGPPDARQAP
ncbi:kumamolisin [Cellulomonas chitinilytica]|uniref:Kumamolisin n=1 Tax=Cellulomonas chitinilytica TaxID=398759 RepID=A0A919P4G6_9CELL|nr:S53 family peptidase [Cellulomonas chitinilytica]GIG23202.1 kumamolisin [Cellulomonas chitinilytica]